jgi:REP element-mobilizing transposase RayT
MPRQARLDFPGTLHHVIVRGIGRNSIVKDDVDRADFIERLGRLSHETETAIYAWSLMTNHAHILLRTSEVERIRDRQNMYFLCWQKVRGH